MTPYNKALNVAALLISCTLTACVPENTTPEIEVSQPEVRVQETASEKTLEEIRLEAVGLFEGTSGRVDEKRAGQLFKKAADGGDTLAKMWMAAQYFFGGCGFPEDTNKAESLAKEVLPEVQQMAEAGNTEAQVMMGVFYFAGLGVDEDKTRAVRWLTLSAEQGNSIGMVFVGGGAYQSQNYPEALKWLEKAHELGHPEGTTLLGQMYLEGNGVEQDYDKALEYFRTSAAKGQPSAMLYLGYVYRNGIGVSQDMRIARKWFRKSASKGSKAAAEILKDF